MKQPKSSEKELERWPPSLGGPNSLSGQRTSWQIRHFRSSSTVHGATYLLLRISTTCFQTPELLRAWNRYDLWMLGHTGQSSALRRVHRTRHSRAAWGEFLAHLLWFRTEVSKASAERDIRFSSSYHHQNSSFKIIWPSTITCNNNDT